ncbi:ABC transporter permease subunit [Mycoplasma sp. 6243]|uniref:ABC transporter permease subunit n=1 Tax=Mycoplasma sp. 6243 TaxID=3440865 RepID=UPI003EBDC4AA
MYKKAFKEALIIILIVILIIIILFPIYILIVSALMPTDDVVNKRFTIRLRKFDFSNFNFFSDIRFWKAVGLSLSSSLMLLSIRLITYTLFVIGISKLGKRSKKVILLIILILSFIPEFAIYLSLNKVLNKLNITNSLTPLSLVTNGFFSYFFMYNLLIHFEKSKQKYYKAMKIDNLTLWQKIYLIYWKEMKETYILLIIFSFVSVWNDYLWPNYILSGTNDATVGIWFRQIGQVPAGGSLLNIQSAGALVVIAIPLTVYFIFSKKIVRSV